MKESSSKIFVLLSAILAVEFIVIFYGIDLLTASRPTILTVNFLWENKTPYIPSFFIVYYSVLILPFSVGFLIKQKEDIKLWFTRMSYAIVISGIIFLIIPSQANYPSVTNNNFLYFKKISLLITGHYNMMPSLHVALSIIIIGSIWGYLQKPSKIVFFAWGVALLISTIFTHQHHFVDVLLGIVLSCGIIKYKKRLC